MKIETSKSIKIESAKLRAEHFKEPCEDTKHDFNEFQFKKWAELDELIKEIDCLTDRIICIPNYSDGETHVQYAFRYGKLMQKSLKKKLLTQK